MSFDHTQVIDVRDFMNDPKFLKYCEYELGEIKRKPDSWQRVSGRLADWPEVQRNFWQGHAPEWVLLNNTKLEKCTGELISLHGSYRRNYEQLYKTMDYQDLYDVQHDRIVEVKVVNPRYTNPDNFWTGNLGKKLIEGYGRWVFCDTILFYERIGEYQSRYSWQLNFRDGIRKLKGIK